MKLTQATVHDSVCSDAKFDATLRPDQGIHYSGVCPSSLTTATLDMLELQMVGVSHENWGVITPWGSLDKSLVPKWTTVQKLCTEIVCTEKCLVPIWIYPGVRTNFGVG